MKKTFVCLDVGGTQIKAASVDAEGGIFGGGIGYFPAEAGGSAEELLGHFEAIIREVRTPETEMAGIRLAFPGPFDYENGICLLRGLDKYDRLYGVNLRRELAERMGIPPKHICFANDVAAYALGEMGFGEARGAAKALFICIGTGCGSAFGVKGRLAPPGTLGVPENGYVYDSPFMDGCIDDYISRRGLMELTRKQLGVALDGRELARRVQNGDEAARQCFLIFGSRVWDALTPFLERFHPEMLCMGGQITRSGNLFLAPLEGYCHAAGIRLAVTEDTSLRTLQGLTRI